MKSQNHLIDFISLGLIRDLELLALDNNCVLWISTKDFDTQLFVSSNYPQLFGQSCGTLYRTPAAWVETLDSDSEQALQFQAELRKQRRVINPNYTAIYTVRLSNTQRHWFQDRSFQLDADNKDNLLIAGAALQVTKEDIEKHQETISHQLDLIVIQYAKILNQSCAINEMNLPNYQLLKQLTNREMQAFKLFIRGKTIIEVAQHLHLSPRTVESHLVNIKGKLLCESKSELIMKAIENHWLKVNIE